MVKNQPPEPGRIAIPMSAELVQRIDEHRWRERLPSRAASIRVLIEIGLKSVEGNARPPAK